MGKLSDKEATMLFQAKCVDLELPFAKEKLTTFKKNLEFNFIMRSLDLCGCQLGPQSAVAISLIMKHNTSFCKYCLGSNFIGDKGIESIAEVLREKKCSFIKLDVSNNGITETGFACLFSSLQRNESVVDLNIGSERNQGRMRNKLGEKGLKGLRELLTNNQMLSILDLSGL